MMEGMHIGKFPILCKMFIFLIKRLHLSKLHENHICECLSMKYKKHLTWDTL
jgi:hypothetical protein